MNNPHPIVSVSWLIEHRAHPSTLLLDASMGASTRGRIPGARIFDFDKRICDMNSPLPHMMPSPEHFEKEVRALGIDQEHTLVVYDDRGIFSAPRARWMFRAMGHENVSVLDGGLPAWIANGGQTVHDAERALKEGNFRANPKFDLFCNADAVAEALARKSAVVIDVRSRGRFLGDEPEPRPGLRPGHMPGAVNIPYTTFLSGDGFRPRRELQAVLAPVAPVDRKLIFSCGSGVTACIGAMAAEMAGYREIAVYDGSWSEWGLPSSRPVACGV